MSIETAPQRAVTPPPSIQDDVRQAKFSENADQRVTSTSRKPKKFGARINMWIRRIHLFSGLFMLPWVLLYGFTALLFNHPTYLPDSRTEIEHFALTSGERQELPQPILLAESAVLTANSTLQAVENRERIVLADDPNAVFTRQVFGAVEDDSRNVSVILDLNNGTGYLRKRARVDQSKDNLANNSEASNLDEVLKLSIDSDPFAGFKKSVSQLLGERKLESDNLQIRSMPNLEFDAMVDGEAVRLRLSQERSNRRRPGEGNPAAARKPDYRCQLSIVGKTPREMSVRSFLLRLHTAHGYGIQTNARWFWAIAVDLMFASMCFWGLSGVVMWWQIKRTRRLGLIFLIASGVIATWLAIGMHWQLVNG